VPEDRKPLTPEQRKTAAEIGWYRAWLLASGRTEAELRQATDEEPPGALGGPSRRATYVCSGCNEKNRAINDVTGRRHTETARKPSGCHGTWALEATS
jgi:hypothetical protein